jgi:ABC-2 type transport system ATP-binding protein
MPNNFVVDVHQLSRSFNGVKAVKNATLSIKKGEIFGFLGPNGSGKTTTIRMLCGLLTPDSGEGKCLGFDILREAGLIKLNTGYMTQTFSLYQDLTVKENLHFIGKLYGVRDLKQTVQNIIADLQLGPYANRLAGVLSGGWKQRLALGAALVHNPKLLLLDEPTAGIDPKARKDFWNHLNQLSVTGITTLVSTHYMDEAERCHRLACISKGEILTQGSKTEIIKNSNLITWRVSGEQLSQLAEELKKNSLIKQIIFFGDALRISGEDHDALHVALKPFFGKGYVWEEITPNLEDVFISLVSRDE